MTTACDIEQPTGSAALSDAIRSGGFVSVMFISWTTGRKYLGSECSIYSADHDPKTPAYLCGPIYYSISGRTIKPDGSETIRERIEAINKWHGTGSQRKKVYLNQLSVCPSCGEYSIEHDDAHADTIHNPHMDVNRWADLACERINASPQRHSPCNYGECIGCKTARMRREASLVLVPDSRYIYALKAGPFFKIGVATSIPSRIRQLQTGCPQKIEFLYAVRSNQAAEHEGMIHKRLEDAHSYGEWFRDVGDRLAMAVGEMRAIGRLLTSKDVEGLA